MSDGTDEAPVFQRVSFLSSLDGLGRTSSAVVRGADVAWSWARAYLWLTYMPFSMLVVGVTSPSALRRGHRGPLRRAFKRGLQQHDARRAPRARSGADAAAATEGSRLAVRGTIRARATLPSVGDARAVAHRVVYKVTILRRGTERLFVVYEAAVDFDVALDGTDDVVRVEATDAHLSIAHRKHRGGPTPDFGSLPAPPDLVAEFLERKIFDVSAKSYLLCDGDRVECVGTKGTYLDPDVEERTLREVPLRTCLRADQGGPLVILDRR